jgi:alkylated DNA repair protein (DNA oxidative demethylase)
MKAPMPRGQFEFMAEPPQQELAPGAFVLRGFALPVARALLDDVARIAEVAPFRHMTTPGGHRMSVAMTNCGALGWITDERGYRYTGVDPASGRPWPAMPASFAQLAASAAAAAGYAAFAPDACLVNRYEPGARMTLHQDRNERERTQPIVSVSLGLPVVFLFGGLERKDSSQRVGLEHGDVVVWGGPSRLCFHGVLPLREGEHGATGRCRINLTLRCAG